MEEDIEIIQEMLRLNKKRIEPQIVQAIENLINKYKELEKESFEDYKYYFDLVQEDNELLVEKENKIKELEKERDGIYADYQDLGKEKLLLEKENQIVKGANEYWTMRFCEATNGKAEQEKIIFLMAKYIAGTVKDEDICKKVGKNPFCDEFGEKSKCEECVIDYFRKKAKGE